MTEIKSKKIYNIYQKLIKHKLSLIYIFLALIFISFFLDILLGPANLTIKEVFTSIITPDNVDEKTRVIVWIYRIPIALMAILVGASLGIAGSQMQTILNNPLASPFTLGISAAAGFGASLAMVFGSKIIPPEFGIFTVPLAAFLMALLSTFIIYSFGILKKESNEILILTGVALVFLFNSLISLIQYFSTQDELQAIVFWIFGSLVRTTWSKVAIIFVIMIIITSLLVKKSWQLTAFRLGDIQAQSLGIDVKKIRLNILIYISLLTAAAVCFVGSIGFIGLVGPHIARMLVGEDQRFFMPFSAICGALILSVSSILSKIIFPGSIFPVGIITSLIGIPFFLILIIRSKKSYW